MIEPSYTPYDVSPSAPSSAECDYCAEGSDIDHAHHHAYYVSKDGAASRTADNLAAVFLDDVSGLVPAYVVPEWVAAIEWDRDYSAGWCVDPDDAQALSDEIPSAESALYDVGLYVDWDDGYIIGAIVDESEDAISRAYDAAPKCARCGNVEANHSEDARQHVHACAEYVAPTKDGVTNDRA